VLEREDDLVVVGEASSEPEAEAVVRATHPDVVLLDLKLSAGSDFEGLSLWAKLSAAHPGIGLLVLTTFLDEDLVVRALSGRTEPRQQLTDREIEVLRLLAAGLSTTKSARSCSSPRRRRSST
jgi:two-component system, NarL family, response regulator DevR